MESLLDPADPAAETEVGSKIAPKPKRAAKTNAAGPSKRRTPRARSAAATKTSDGDSRPDTVLRTLGELHTQFAERAAAALSTALRTAVELRLAGVSRDTCSGYLRKLDRTACLCFVRVESIGEMAVAHCDAAILYPLIDRLLGGRGDYGPDTQRPLTPIELKMASRIFRLLLALWQSVWASMGDVRLEIMSVDSVGPEPTRFECDPRWIERLPPGEAVVGIECELKAGAARGKTTFCIPWRIAEQLAACGPRAGSMHPAPPPANDGRPTVQAVVDLANTSLAADELAGLQVGDIIATDTDHTAPLVVRVNGVPRFLARPGAYKGRKAVCVESAIEPTQE
jgi:flagellar motor switch protein FliM